MYSSVFVIVVLGIYGSFCVQDLRIDELEETLSTVVCEQCACADGLVDCTDRGLKESFSMEEWNGLRNSDVTEIRLCGNSIEMLTQISDLPIKVLNVSNARIDRIEDECFKYLPELESLDLSHNRIMILNRRVFWALPNYRAGLLNPTTSKFRPFVKMKHLNLAHNELHTLPKDAFGFMQELVSLDLSGNPLGVIDQVVMGSLSDLIFLQELKLSGCELETLPVGLLRRQRRLQRLDISDNKFKVMPAVLSEAVNLRSLNFDRNLITSLGEERSLSKLSNLEELSICRNLRLQSIGPNALGGLESLVSLSICNNPRLSIIDDDFLTWIDDHDIERRPLLRALYLHNNNLTEIDSDFLFRWDQLQRMDFSDNPFVCDCSNQWMVDVLVPFVLNNNASADDMICKTPQEMRGLSFTQLYQSSRVLPCPTTQEVQEPTEPHTAIVLGVMIGVFATFPMVLIVVLLWKRGYFAKCRKSMRNEEDSEDENGAF